MSKVLLATIDFPPQRGGVARYLGAIKETFNERVDVLYWEGRTPKYVSLLWQLYKASKQHKAIWVSHIVPVGTAALVLRLLIGKPYVLFLHGMDFDLAKRNGLRKWLTYGIVTAADQVVCNSQALAKEVADFARVDPKVVYPTVQDEFLATSDAFVHRRDAFHAPPIHVLTVARLVERKGHEKVLQAIKHLPHVTYDIVGDGPERRRLEERIVDLGLHKRVRIYPHVSDEELPSLYAAADIFVMPTTKSDMDREGFGIVYLEAALFGLPVIATDHPGVDEAVIDNKTGVLIEDTPEALHAAIDQLCEDPGRRERLGKAGREFVLAGFTREQQMRKLEELL